MDTAEFPNHVDQLAYSVADVARLTSLSKSFIRNEIQDKRIKAKRCNRRLLIMPHDLEDYLAKLIEG